MVRGVSGDVSSSPRSYNKVLGDQACNSPKILTDDLREKMGFDGWVMSDWWAADGVADGLAGHQIITSIPP